MAGGIVATVHKGEVARFETDHEAILYPSFDALLAAHSASTAAEGMHSASAASEERHR